LQIDVNKHEKDKIGRAEFKQESKELKEIMYKIHTVMDYFSNEFMRLENFIERYLPLKVQNQISHTLNFVIEPKNKWRLKDYDD
jgi:hypothetical protein